MIVFRIPGEPRGWRVNTNTRGGFASTHLTKHAKAWRADAVRLLTLRVGNLQPLEDALFIRVDAVFARPKRLDCSHSPSCSTRDESARLCAPHVVAGASQHHLSTPDATNVHKLAEDALVKAGVIRDDRFVARYAGSKRYARRGEEPFVEITVRPLRSLPLVV